MFPVGSAIVLEMKVYIKGFPNKSSQAIHHETNMFVRDRETIMVVTLKGDMKTMGRSTQTRLQCKTH